MNEALSLISSAASSRRNHRTRREIREAVDFLCKFLTNRGIDYKIVAPQATMPNIVASFTGASAGRHLVLNGHIDVFPAGDGAGWKRDPWSGEVADGVVWVGAPPT